MNNKYVSFAVVALLVISVLVVFRDPEDETADDEREAVLEELEEENDRLKNEVIRLDGKVEELTATDNEDIAEAITIVEDYLSSDDIEEAKPYFSNEVQIPAEDPASLQPSPNSIQFSPVHIIEWRPDEYQELEFKNFSRGTDVLFLYYRPTASESKESEVPVSRFIMTEEDGWKISRIEPVRD